MPFASEIVRMIFLTSAKLIVSVSMSKSIGLVNRKSLKVNEYHYQNQYEYHYDYEYE